MHMFRIYTWYEKSLQFFLVRSTCLMEGGYIICIFRKKCLFLSSIPAIQPTNNVHSE